MTTAAQWQCVSCRTTNPPNNTECSNCGTIRVVDLGTARQGAQQPMASRPGTPTVIWPQQNPPGSAPGPAADKAPPAQRGVTRYLCCAVQLDARLARRAIEEIVKEPRRAVASSPGVDLPVVLAYALTARRRQFIRDCVLALLLLLIFYLYFKSLTMFVLLAFLGAWAVVAGELFYVNYAVIVPKLSRKTFNPSAAPMPHSTRWMSRLREVGTWDTGNVMVSRDFAPFPGYGKPAGSWSYTIATDDPKKDADTTRPFAIHELYDHVSTAVQDLHLHGVSVENRLFVNGKDLRTELGTAMAATLLPDPRRAPAARVAERLLRDLRQEQSGRARPYLVLHVSGWEGELVATQFLRFYLSPHRDMLFVENSVSVLAGVHASYRSVDTLLDHPTFLQSAEIILSALPRTILMLPGSYKAVSGAIMHAFAFKTWRQLWAIRVQTFNYGASMSLRQAASDRRYHRYFQKVDVEMYNKMVASRVLNSLIEFLDQHNIDTSKLSDQSPAYMDVFSIGDKPRASFAKTALAIFLNLFSRILYTSGTWGGSHGIAKVV